MYVSDPMSDDQPLIRFFTHDKFKRLLDPALAYDSWQSVIGKEPAVPNERYGSLWMALPHKLEDKDEGTFPTLNMNDEQYCEAMAKHLGKSTKEEAECRERYLNSNAQDLRAGIRARAKLCGVSCWYQDSVETQRMWDEFSSSGSGVLIKTNLKHFELSITQIDPFKGNQASQSRFRTINYVDLNRFFLAQDGYWDLLAIKGEGFIPEREVRLIGHSPELVKLLSKGKCSTLTEIQKVANHPPAGFNLLIDLSVLVTEVRVHPLSTDDYLEEIRELVGKKGIDKKAVQHSELAR